MVRRLTARISDGELQSSGAREFSAAMTKLCDSPPKFYNLDVWQTRWSRRGKHLARWQRDTHLTSRHRHDGCRRLDDASRCENV